MLESYFSPMYESVKELYISAVQQRREEIDADVQVRSQQHPSPWLSPVSNLLHPNMALGPYWVLEVQQVASGLWVLSYKYCKVFIKVQGSFKMVYVLNIKKYLQFNTLGISGGRCCII